MERAKWTDKIKKCNCARRVGDGRIMLELIKRGGKLAEPLAKKQLSAEGSSRRNGKREESSRHKKISDDRQHYGMY